MHYGKMIKYWGEGGRRMVDVLVVGAGHAGVEAALSCARLGKKTILFTLDENMIASMPCNPSVGGPAKGVVVREIDALGGQMGRVADLTALQFKMLNTTKGPGVQSLRVQSDKLAYSRMMKEILLREKNLELQVAMIKGIIVENEVVKGVVLENGETVMGSVVILTTGTYLDSKVMVSSDVKSEGPDGQRTTAELTLSLQNAGLETFRLKTGTPARIYTDSIDFSVTEEQKGSEEFYAFSYQTKPEERIKNPVSCFLTYTNQKTHEIIQENLHRSSMYSGVVIGRGPRYCPSIEDKIVRFADKERHQIFLEPESLELDTTYVQGLSSSLPYDVQEKMIHSLKGLEQAKIKKYAYAIEFDAINPLQLKPSLENKKIENLFFAGQINGTSGYEEAAAQGLLAGINACQKLDEKEPLILRRDESYIGVMIDDLVTKGTEEPYRLLTSRAEYRLLLRHDNADLRLTEYGKSVGLVSDQQYEHYLQKKEGMAELFHVLQNTLFKANELLVAYLKEKGYMELNESINGIQLVKRPKVHIVELAPFMDYEINADIAHCVEIEIKYAGYIEKAIKEAQKLQAMEKLVLSDNLDYEEVAHLSLEGRQKLKEIRPATIGQAARISGVNPADIAVLAVHLEQRHRK